MTIPYAEVIGDPVHFSKSPVIHRFWLEKLGLEGDFRKTRVAAAELNAHLRLRRRDPNWRGCNLTMPLKTLVMPLLDEILAEGEKVGAVNTVFRRGSRLVGTNTDLEGFAEPLRARFRERGSALLIGTGGAARAIYSALVALEFGPIRVMGRAPKPHFADIDHLIADGRYLPLVNRLPKTDLVVNATPIGLAGGPSFYFDLSDLPATAIVYDIVYHPPRTPLLTRAEERGLSTIDGFDMLIGQAAVAFASFFGADPPRRFDEALRGRLTS